MWKMIIVGAGTTNLYEDTTPSLKAVQYNPRLIIYKCWNDNSQSSTLQLPTQHLLRTSIHISHVYWHTVFATWQWFDHWHGDVKVGDFTAINILYCVKIHFICHDLVKAVFFFSSRVCTYWHCSRLIINADFPWIYYTDECGQKERERRKGLC